MSDRYGEILEEVATLTARLEELELERRREQSRLHKMVKQERVSTNILRLTCGDRTVKVKLIDTKESSHSRHNCCEVYDGKNMVKFYPHFDQSTVCVDFARGVF